MVKDVARFEAERKASGGKAVVHQTIGVMITEDDRDLAAWFNMMRGHNASKWIAGMLAAWKLNQTLDAGVCALPASTPVPIRSAGSGGLLFGSGQASVPASKKRNYGWTVKGPSGEYIVGSVINVSIARKEIQPIIQQLRQEGRQLAPFIKALIRSSMTVGEITRLPDIAGLNAVFAQYRLAFSAQAQKEPQEGIQLSRHMGQVNK